MQRSPPGDRQALTAEIVVPPNTTAEIVLPVKGEVTEGGQPVKGRPGIRESAGNRLVAGSGTYRFNGSL